MHYAVGTMYVKRATVKRGETSYVYLRLVEAYREDGKVRHRVIANLGREDELKASGQLDQLAASFARLDPPPGAPAGRSARCCWCATTCSGWGW